MEPGVWYANDNDMKVFPEGSGRRCQSMCCVDEFSRVRRGVSFKRHGHVSPRRFRWMAVFGHDMVLRSDWDPRHGRWLTFDVWYRGDFLERWEVCWSYSRGKVVVRGDAIIAEDRIKIMPHLNMTESYMIKELPDVVQTKTMTNDDVQWGSSRHDVEMTRESV